jgi:FkbH-like protein
MDTLKYLQLAQGYPAADKKSYSNSIRINIVTNFTDQILQRFLIGLCLEQGIYPEIFAVPYRQYDFFLSNTHSELYTNKADITFVFFDVSQLNHSPFTTKEDDHFLKIESYLKVYCSSTNNPVIINSFPLPYHGPFGNLFFKSPFFEKISYYNECYYKLAKDLSNACVIDTGRLLAYYGERFARDVRSMYAFDIPFTNDFSLAIATEWFTFIGQIRGKIKKCLVLDLDNTLWGGVVGEVGAHGVALGPNYPGVAFQNFQRAILACYERGILLAINSKNNQADVDELFEKNGHMILKKHHFAAIRINWGNKVENIISLAKELNLGFDSLVFIDDDPLNREMVQRQLPGVLVPNFSLSPELYAHTLFSLPIFNQFSLTSEDLEKGKMYNEEKMRKDMMSITTSPEDYIATLQLSVDIHCNDKTWIPRISQLTLKTNQFNVTTRRYGEKEIEEFMKGGYVYGADVNDKFGSYGITILAIVLPDGEGRARIDTFLMSCRVLGRGIEDVFIDAIIKELKQKNISRVVAEFIPTAKNEPAKNFFQKNGFFIQENSDKTEKIVYTLLLEGKGEAKHPLLSIIKVIK